MPWRSELKKTHFQRKQQNRWRERNVLTTSQGREIAVDGRTLLNFCSNDYLGLASHPALRQAAIAATEKHGTGSGAAHLVCGHHQLHAQLEETLATLVGSEKALVFSTGYMANLAVPQSFLGRNDMLLEDRLNHASLLDAGTVAPVKMKRYPHRDVDAIANLLNDSDAKRKMILTDGTFSMDGDVAPVQQLADACRKHDAVLVVDDAHGFGVLGDTGAGLLERENVSVGRNVIMIGTLGKAAGSFGAFVAGDAVYIESLIQFARTYIYTTALPPAVAAASLTAVELFESEAWRRDRLHELIEQFRQRASDTKLPVLDSGTAIQPILLGSESAALEADALLREHGVLGIAIRPPTVPTGSARIRLTLRADHTDEDLEQLFNVLDSDRFRQLAVLESQP